MKKLLTIGLLIVSCGAYASDTPNTLWTAGNCITDRAKIYAVKTCEPANVIVGAAKSACYNDIQKAKSDYAKNEKSSLKHASDVVDITIDRLQGHFYQAILDARIAASKQCNNAN